MINNILDNDSPFDEGFCTHLEFHLCRAFQQSNKKDIKDFWCDGVSWNPTPYSQLTKKSINNTRSIKTKAWLGKNGQEEYEMSIQFGSSSLRHYAKGLSLIDCIPGEETMDWITIDIEKNTISIQLK